MITALVKCCLLICPLQLSEHWLLHAVIHVIDLHTSCVHDSLVGSAQELGVQTFITSLPSVNAYTAPLHTVVIFHTYSDTGREG